MATPLIHFACAGSEAFVALFGWLIFHWGSGVGVLLSLIGFVFSLFQTTKNPAKVLCEIALGSFALGFAGLSAMNLGSYMASGLFDNSLKEACLPLIGAAFSFLGRWNAIRKPA